MHQNGLSYLIIELEDSGQPVQGIQPKNNNKGNPQMFGKRLSTLCRGQIYNPWPKWNLKNVFWEFLADLEWRHV